MSNYAAAVNLKNDLKKAGFDQRFQKIDWATDLSPSEKRVLETLFDFVQDKPGWSGIFPTAKTLAWRSQVSERQVYRIRNSLRNKGYIDWVTERDPNTWHLKSEYFIQQSVGNLKTRKAGEKYSRPKMSVFSYCQNVSDPSDIMAGISNTKCDSSNHIQSYDPKGLRGGQHFENGEENATREPGGGKGERRTGNPLLTKNLDSFESFLKDFGENEKRDFVKNRERGFGCNDSFGLANPRPMVVGQGFIADNRFSRSDESQTEFVGQELAGLKLSEYLRRTGGLTRIEIALESGSRVRLTVPLGVVPQVVSAVAAGEAARSSQEMLKRVAKGVSRTRRTKRNQQEARAVMVDVRDDRISDDDVSEGDAASAVASELGSVDDLPYSKAKQLRGKTGRSEKLQAAKERKFSRLRESQSRNRQKQQESKKASLHLQAVQDRVLDRSVSEQSESEEMPRRATTEKGDLESRGFELFEFFLKRCNELSLVPETEECPMLDARYAGTMIQDVGVGNAQAAIDWALKNYDWLKKADDRLAERPYFYHLTARHRYSYYLKRLASSSVARTPNQAPEKAENSSRSNPGMVAKPSPKVSSLFGSGQSTESVVQAWKEQGWTSPRSAFLEIAPVETQAPKDAEQEGIQQPDPVS